jgi:putative redox protein
MTASIVYKGQYRCECTHMQSGTVIETDAPTDNRGRGERFSPTDTVCVALATCIITTIALKAGDMQIDLAGAEIGVTKHMVPDPRRIGRIDVSLNFPASIVISEANRAYLQQVGDNCPVAKSLHPGIILNIAYCWGQA